MATQKNKRGPSVGFYSEPSFVSLNTTLRKLSGDETLPTDKYVDIYKDLYDLINPDDRHDTSGVVDINLTIDKNKLVILYSDNTTKEIVLTDDYLYRVYYDNISKLVYFVLKNGEKITLDLNFLFDQFASKEELEQIKNEVSEELNSFKEEVKILIDETIGDEIETIVENKFKTEINQTIEQKFQEGVTDIKWKSF